MGNLHGGFHVAERVRGHHTAKQCNIQRNGADCCIFDGLLHLLCLYLLHAGLDIGLHHVGNGLHVFRRIENDLGCPRTILVFRAFLIGNAGDGGEKRLVLLLLVISVFQHLRHQFRQLTRTNSQVGCSDQLLELGECSPTAL